MGQADVIEVLKKNKKPLSAREISEIIECNVYAVNPILNKLLKFKEIRFIEVGRKEANLKYNSKRRLRIYYL